MHRSIYSLPETCPSIALVGGPYSNFAAVKRFLEITQHIEHRFCLGDIGGFGPHPDRTLQLIRDHKLICIQGNYDHAVGFGERDCGCGYSTCYNGLPSTEAIPHDRILLTTTGAFHARDLTAT